MVREKDQELFTMPQKPLRHGLGRSRNCSSKKSVSRKVRKGREGNLERLQQNTLAKWLRLRFDKNSVRSLIFADFAALA